MYQTTSNGYRRLWISKEFINTSIWSIKIQLQLFTAIHNYFPPLLFRIVSETIEKAFAEECWRESWIWLAVSKAISKIFSCIDPTLKQTLDWMNSIVCKGVKALYVSVGPSQHQGTIVVRVGLLLVWREVTSLRVPTASCRVSGTSLSNTPDTSVWVDAWYKNECS